MPEGTGKPRHAVAVHVAATVVTLAGFVVLAAVVERQGPALFDTGVIAAIRPQTPPWLVTGFEALSTVTGGIGAAAAGATLAVLLWHFDRRSSGFLVVALAGAGLLNQLGKWLLSRHRPGPVLPTAELSIDDYAFPSGHAMISMAFALALWLVARRLVPRMQAPVAAASGIVVLLVGLARVSLGRHYPTDVLGGWLLGSAWVLLVHAWYGRTPSETQDGDEEQASV